MNGWLAIVEKVRSDHNGVMSVNLHFGHDGDCTCTFRDYEKTLATFSCDNMQRSVEKCLEAWQLEKGQHRCSS